MEVWPDGRRCAQCREPLRAGARSDAKFCSRACKAAHRRRRRHYDEAVAIGLAYLWGEPTEHVATCPQCGRLFALGHGHRRDAVYDRLYGTDPPSPPSRACGRFEREALGPVGRARAACGVRVGPWSVP